MRHTVFIKVLAARLGCVVALAFWAGQMSFAFAQSDNPDEFSCYPHHPKWGWYQEQSQEPSTPVSQEASANPVALRDYSDPTSLAHPAWDSLPTEQPGNTQTNIPESQESSESWTSISDTSDEPSWDTSEPSPNIEAGEVQSMEEYFQRYGHTYAGSQPENPTTSENPADGLPQENESFFDNSEENQTESEESTSTHLEHPDKTDIEISPSEGGTPSASEAETADQPTLPEEEDHYPDPLKETNLEDGEDYQTSPPNMEDQEEPWEGRTSSEEQQEELSPESEQQENASPDEEKESEENMEGQEETTEPASEDNNEDTPEEPAEENLPTTPEETSSAESQQTPPANAFEAMEHNTYDHGQWYQPGDPEAQQDSSVATETQNLPSSSGVQESSPEDSSPWQYESSYERVGTEYAEPVEPEDSSHTSEAMESSADNTSESDSGSEEEHSPPADFIPHDHYEYPEQNWEEWRETPSPSEDAAPTQTEATPSDEEPYPMKTDDSLETSSSLEGETQESPEAEASSPEPSSETPKSETDSPEATPYQWWLENPDTWSEDGSQESPSSEGEEKNSDQESTSSTSGNYDPQEQYPTMDEETAGLEPSFPPEFDSSSENGPDASDNLESQSNPQTEPLHHQGDVEPRSEHPTILEGFGHALLRWLKPWGESLSEVLDISAHTHWFSDRFSMGQSEADREDAANRVPEAISR